ncbi:hypothetical protein ACN47E_009555 [Coniothyrium glycines]
MPTLLSLLLTVGLVAAAPHSAHYGTHRARHMTPSMSPRNTLGSLQRMSTADVEAIYKTCWNGALEWPLPNTPNPVIDVVSPQLSIFEVPASTPNTLTIHNYCDYDIHFNHFNGGSAPESGCLTSGTSIDRPLTGTVFKASKNENMGSDLLVEYSIDATGVLWYNLSLLTCMVDGDTSACAGHEAGLQLSNPGKMAFQCAGGAWCDDQAYLYHENLCKKQNPVCLGSPSQGLTMEFCASKKS